jgi:hypothetical protein
MNTDIYTKLHDAVIGTLEAYQEDLTKHDKNTLSEYPGAEFLHFTRSTGTWLYILDVSAFPPTDDPVPYMFGMSTRRKILSGLVTNIERVCADNKLIHHHKNGKLRTVRPAEAIFIASDFVRRAIKQWDAQRKLQQA